MNQFILWNKKYILNLAPPEQQPIQGLLEIEHGTITEKEHIVHEQEHPDPDPIHKRDLQDPKDIFDKLATVPNLIEKPAADQQTPDPKPADKPATKAAPTCDTSPKRAEDKGAAPEDTTVVPKKVRVYEKDAAPEVRIG